MEAADVLYGVSMPPGGSSRVVTQRIRDLQLRRGELVASLRAWSSSSSSLSSRLPCCRSACSSGLARRRRRTKERGRVAGEPPSGPPPVATKPVATKPVATKPAVAPPAAESLEDLLRAPSVRSGPEAPNSRHRRFRRGARGRRSPRLRDRLGRTRSAFSGAFGRICGAARSTTRRGTNSKRRCSSPTSGCSPRPRMLDAVRVGRAKETSVTEPDELIGLLRDEVISLLTTDADRSLHIVAGGVERVDVRRGERRREDDDDRQARIATGAEGPAGAARRGRHVSSRGRRSAAAVGRAHRRRARARTGRRRSRFGGVRRDGRRVRVADADLVLVDTAGRLHTKSESHGGAEEAAPDRRSHARARSRRCCW